MENERILKQIDFILFRRIIPGMIWELYSGLLGSSLVRAIDKVDISVSKFNFFA